MKKRIILNAVIAIMMIGCKLPTVSEVEILGVEETKIEQNATLFQGSGEEGITTFRTNDKGYLKGGKGSTLWTVMTNHGEGRFEEITVEVSKTSGNALGGYGVVFCIQGNRMLSVLINKDRQYAIGKITGGRYEKLQEWKPSLKLHKGDIVNNINIKKDGSQFVLSFNGQEETRFSDTKEGKLEVGEAGYAVVISPEEEFPQNSVEVRFKKIRM